MSDHSSGGSSGGDIFQEISDIAVVPGDIVGGKGTQRYHKSPAVKPDQANPDQIVI
jgi:hypothetical protein